MTATIQAKVNSRLLSKASRLSPLFFTGWKMAADRAYGEAQKRLAEAAEDEKLIGRARREAEVVIKQLCRGFGVRVGSVGVSRPAHQRRGSRTACGGTQRDNSGLLFWLSAGVR